MGRPVDVGVQHADLEAEGGQTERQIGRDGGFPDPALAAGDRDDRTDPGNQRAHRAGPAGLLRPRTGPGTGRTTGLGGRTCGTLPRLDRGRVAVGGQDRGHRDHPGQVVHGLLRLLAQRLHLGGVARVDLDDEADVAVLEHQPRDHAERDDVGLARRLDHGLERRHDPLFGDLTHP